MKRPLKKKIAGAAKVICAALVVGSIYAAGCSAERDTRNLIPESRLPEARKAEIKEALRDDGYMRKAARYKFAERFGSDGVPFMIERVMEIYELGSDWKNPHLYSVATNLIISLGEIGDERAVPALTAWLAEPEYRVFRISAAYALGEMGDKSQTAELWKIWEEEFSYLEKGDDEGPWPFIGYHPSGCYVHRVLAETGEALYKLGEERVVADMIEAARLSRGRWTSGYNQILWTLAKMTGEGISEETYELEFWQAWWNNRKRR